MGIVFAFIIDDSCFAFDVRYEKFGLCRESRVHSIDCFVPRSRVLLRGMPPFQRGFMFLHVCRELRKRIQICKRTVLHPRIDDAFS